jgi:hypothetical protein
LFPSLKNDTFYKLGPDLENKLLEKPKQEDTDTDIQKEETKKLLRLREEVSKRKEELYRAKRQLKSSQAKKKTCKNALKNKAKRSKKNKALNKLDDDLEKQERILARNKKKLKLEIKQYN